MAKEHLQANGQPPKVGAGARLSRASTRGRVSAWARGATAMLKKRIFSAQAERFGSCRWSQCRLGSLNEEAAREARSSHTQWLFSWLSGRVKIPAGQGLVLSHSCTEQQEGQASKGASGDMVVVGCSLSLSHSPFLSSTVKEGRGKTTGARVTRHLGK